MQMKINIPPSVPYAERLYGEWAKIANSQEVSQMELRNAVSVEAVMHPTMMNLIFGISTYCAAREVHEETIKYNEADTDPIILDENKIITVPKTWWDFAKLTFRERFPKAGRRLQVVFNDTIVPIHIETHNHKHITKHTRVVHMCPHLLRDGERDHFTFLAHSPMAPLEAPHGAPTGGNQ